MGGAAPPNPPGCFEAEVWKTLKIWVEKNFMTRPSFKVVAEAKGFATKVWPAVSQRVSGFKK